MAVQLINIGNVANDGTGDDLREAFIKTNANFEELDLRDDEQTTVSNLGEVGEGLFGISFKMKGVSGKIKTTINPIKTLTPRFIQKIIEKDKKSK